VSFYKDKMKDIHYILSEFSRELLVNDFNLPTKIYLKEADFFSLLYQTDSKFFKKIDVENGEVVIYVAAGLMTIIKDSLAHQNIS
jgi:hypothetical protein